MSDYRRLAEALIYGGHGLPETTASRALGVGHDAYREAVISEWTQRLQRQLSYERATQLSNALDTLETAIVTARCAGSGGGSSAEILGDIDDLPLVDAPEGADDAPDVDLLIAQAQAQDEMDELRDELEDDEHRESTPSAGQQIDEVRKLSELGWMPSLDALAMIRSIPTMPMGRRGSGRMSVVVRSLTGAQISETATPRAMGRKSNSLRKLNIANGRRCMTMSRGELRIHLILDTSGSMRWTSGVPSDAPSETKRIQYAGGVLASIWRALSEQERAHTRLYRYTDGLFPLQFQSLPSVVADGGTRLDCIQPLLQSAGRDDRYIVISDGEIPDMSAVTSQNMALLCICPAGDLPKYVEGDSRVISVDEAPHNIARHLRLILR